MTEPVLPPAEEIARRLISRFEGNIGPDDFGFVYRTYDRPPREVPDRFTDGSIHGYRAEAPFYPASVIKLFFMVALFRRVKDGEIVLDSEDERALANMIRVSCNDATQYLVCRISDAWGGGPLPEPEMTAWWEKRAWTQRYFESHGWPEFSPIRVLHATYEECPYGRDKIARDLHGMNVLTPLAAASMLHAIAARQAIDPPSSERMMTLLSREWQRHESDDSGNQVHGFLGAAVPEGVRVWSKGGHTSTTRHDVVYLENQKGRAMTVAAFTRGAFCSGSMAVLGTLGELILEASRFDE